jgi:parallel beta-helix repeat protein
VTLALGSSALAADLHVPGDFPTIQAAVDAAAPGDRVYVDGGVHVPFGVIVPDLEVIATGGALIDGGGAYACIEIVAPGVTIDGFRVRNAETGIEVFADGVRIVRNTCYENSYVGIYVGGNDNTIERNLMKDNGSGLTIDAFKSGNLVRANVSRSNGGWGFAVFNATANTFIGNTAARNGLQGFLIGSGGFTGVGDDYVDNVAEENALAGFSCGGRGNLFEGNLARRNGDSGFQLGAQATDNTLTGNRSSWNRGFGFSDGSTGSGTAGTANDYSGNTAVSNAAGASDPAGLTS